jgi:hypothetical protein
MKTYSEYMQESADLAEEGMSLEALHACLNGVWAYCESRDAPLDYRHYITLGDRYTAAGYFEYVDRTYEKAMMFAGNNPKARAEVLVAHAGSSLIMERMLDQVPVQLTGATEILQSLDGELTEDTITITNTLEELKVVYLEVASRLGIQPVDLAA